MTFTISCNIIYSFKTIMLFILKMQFLTVFKTVMIFVCLLTIFMINHIFLSLDNLFFDYKKIKVKNPLFIIGFPRSGTTFLHKIFLKDNEFTTPKLWELIFAPSILQKLFFYKLSILFKNNNIIEKLNKLFSPITQPLKNIHEINLNNPEEDYLFLMPYGGCFLLCILFPIKEIWNLSNFDHTFPKNQKIRLLNKYKSLVQRHLYFHGKDKIYLSKNPHFTGFSESIKNTFVNCNIVGCHRDPKKSLPSLLSSMNPGYKLISRNIENDIKQFIKMYNNYYKSLVNNYKNQKHFQIISMYDIKYDLEKVILSIYKKFGYKIRHQYINEIKLEAKKSKTFKSKNIYDLKKYNLEKFDFDIIFRGYYKSSIIGWFYFLVSRFFNTLPIISLAWISIFMSSIISIM